MADGGEIPIAVLREFAELVLRSELVAASRAVLDGPPEFALRRALELASLSWPCGCVDEREKGKEGTGETRRSTEAEVPHRLVPHR